MNRVTFLSWCNMHSVNTNIIPLISHNMLLFAVTPPVEGVANIYQCKLSFGLLLSDDKLKAQVWLERNSQIITTSASCTLNIFDSDGLEVISVNSAVSTDGFFFISESPIAAGIRKKDIFFAKVSIVNGGVTYTTGVPLNDVNVIANTLEDIHDESIGKWILNPEDSTLTLYRKDGTILTKMDLSSTIRTLPSYIGRIPR